MYAWAKAAGSSLSLGQMRRQHLLASLLSVCSSGHISACLVPLWISAGAALTLTQDPFHSFISYMLTHATAFSWSRFSSQELDPHL